MAGKQNCHQIRQINLASWQASQTWTRTLPFPYLVCVVKTVVHKSCNQRSFPHWEKNKHSLLKNSIFHKKSTDRSNARLCWPAQPQTDTYHFARQEKPIWTFLADFQSPKTLWINCLHCSIRSETKFHSDLCCTPVKLQQQESFEATSKHPTASALAYLLWASSDDVM